MSRGGPRSPGSGKKLGRPTAEASGTRRKKPLTVMIDPLHRRALDLEAQQVAPAGTRPNVSRIIQAMLEERYGVL